MADQTITPVDVALDAFTTLDTGDYAALTAANAGVLDMPEDGKFVLHAKAGAATTITVTAGGGVLGSLGNLVSAALSQNDEKLMVLSSARFKQLTGADKSKVRITVTDATSVACIKLP